MNNWEYAYRIEGFNISTIKPSEIIKEVLKNQKQLKNVLDLGSGNGRNSIYLSQFANVDSVDIVDRNFLEGINQKHRINFYKSNVSDFIYKKNKYDLILMIRLIQYLSQEELKLLFEKISISIKTNGIIAISYTFSGGIFNQAFNIKKYSHSIKSLKNIFDANMFNIESIKKGCSHTKHVPYNTEVEVYEIILRKNN